ncbi:bifunctional 3,4-dihydroxy-2-butanone-4-phosphate synthase/GTP cyclohydrolase II [Candidatus Sumerlaeota bacterium]|nr:bifunctional 3,4-dihydroxy-2-butanone-4-phosphate synthase/GTP cyclohydrolase II [Candidatus Sumerlaeota bacterium]
MGTKRRHRDPVFVDAEQAIDDFRNGHMLIVTDDEDRENEGDLILAADFVTPEAINFMVTYGRGLVCCPLTEERLERLELPPLPRRHSSRISTAFHAPVDAVGKTTTGTSAQDRAATVRTLIDPNTHPSDLLQPGHLYTLGARPGGVLQRAGHTEATIDLARLAGLTPAGVLCEILDDDGSMARMPRLMAFAERHGLHLVTIRTLIEHRLKTENLVRREVETVLPNRFANWRMIVYVNGITGEHMEALVIGEVDDGEPVLTRVHSQCFTGDTLGSLRCDCRPQLEAAMERIAEEGRGVILYLHQEGRGIGLLNKLRAYHLQDQGKDTVEANEALGFKPDLREYGVGAQVLADLGLKKLRLLTNNPKKIIGLDAFGLEVVEQVPIEVGHTPENRRYLETKRDKLGHRLTIRERE